MNKKLAVQAHALEVYLTLCSLQGQLKQQGLTAKYMIYFSLKAPLK